jgi:pyruvate,orthophosphate dikinase
MYGDVVMGLKPVNKEDIDPFEAIIEKVKEEQGVTLDKDLSVESLKKLVELFKAAIKEQTGQDFPTNTKLHVMLSKLSEFQLTKQKLQQNYQ